MVNIPPELQNIATLFSTLTNYAIYLVGFIAGLFLVIGAIQITTAGGSSRAAENGKQTCLYAGIGLGIALFAKVLVNILGRALNNGAFTPLT